MKKLLFLNASRDSIPAIRRARELGIYVITCDNRSSNPGHQYADEMAELSYLDKDAVAEYCRTHQVDGIVTWSDRPINTVAYVQEQLGLPLIAPYESVCILQDKGRFRQFLEDNGFNVPVQRSFSSLSEGVASALEWNYPVLVKPVDSAGSRGVTCVNDSDQLADAIREALDNSLSGQYIIETFIQTDIPTSDSDFFAVEGQLQHSIFNFKRIDPTAVNPLTTHLLGWPTCLTEQQQVDCLNQLQRLIELLHVNTTILNVEFRIGVDGKAYMMECSPRPGGFMLCAIQDRAYGTHFFDNVILSAVGLPMVEADICQTSDYWLMATPHVEQTGKFQRLKISSEIVTNVVDYDMWIDTNETVEKNNQPGPYVGIVMLRFTDKELFEKVVENANDLIQPIVY
ncbi:MAG: ATP-grasp domain-containing protein [Bacteroidales bacterium]|nr:ATP-grasp domain-containing protein [Candidatus Colimorpha merdihippi]